MPQKPHKPDEENVCHSKRWFLKKATAGAVLTIAGGILLDKVQSSATPDYQALYLKDAAEGDAALHEKEYVLMSESEKEDYIEFIHSNYWKETYLQSRRDS